MENRTCKRNGCRAKYTDSENNETACKFHPGKPIFHDLKKGWTCCNKIVYDWDEFEKLEGCVEGAHSDVKEEVEGGEFFKSSTVENAKNAIRNQQQQPTSTIEEFNKQEEEKEAAKKLEEEAQSKKPFITKNGKYRCSNKGCLKEYDNETQAADECNYHPGNPIFHDFKKSWSCCQATAYEFDEFVKLPTCTVGTHQPKLV